MPERIVLFGGTFNPIHFGHLIVARAVAEHLHFEKVTFVPAAQPPHKGAGGHIEGLSGAVPGVAAAERLEMVRRAIAGDPLFDVTDIELRRPTPSYTFETLMAIRTEQGLDVELVWIIGADMLGELHTWHRAEEVVDMARIVTAARPPWSERSAGALERLRVRFDAGQIARLAEGIVPTPLIDISSSQIRRRVRSGKSIRYLVPESVREHIMDKGLYVQKDTSAGEAAGL